MALSGDAEISGMTDDSRRVQPGDLFVSMPSASGGDPSAFIADAAAAGAVAVVAHNPIGFEAAREAGVAVAVLPAADAALSFNQQLGQLCQTFFEKPTKGMTLIGVTGTNGKTTVAWLLRQALARLGKVSGYLGTLGYQGPNALRSLGNTTPFPVELYRTLALARNEGVEVLAMEVSSHALDQDRVAGLKFDRGVFTNLSQDHLDYHGTLEAYAAAKYRLFTDYAGEHFHAVINAEDDTGHEWIESFVVNDPLEQLENAGPYGTAFQVAGTIPMYFPPLITFGYEFGDLIAEEVKVGVDRIHMKLSYKKQFAHLDLPLGGAFNADNALTVLATLLSLGYTLLEAVVGLSAVEPVPGRFETIPNSRGIGVVVDYAHTPDAMRKVLATARSVTQGKLICVFGCGGDRDRTKRPQMTAASLEHADYSILTTDNPRTEDSDQIFADMTAGADPTRYLVVKDRREAIFRAIQEAQPGDMVAILGKGHETYQIIGREKLAFDDREVAREALA